LHHLADEANHLDQGYLVNVETGWVDMLDDPFGTTKPPFGEM
jgi:hypothetical protein